LQVVHPHVDTFSGVKKARKRDITEKEDSERRSTFGVEQVE